MVNNVELKTRASDMFLANWCGCLSVFFSPPFSYFILNKRTGFLIIKENAPPGTYQFQVRVSDGVWPDAVSSVTVHVRELRDEAIYSSGSLRLAGKIDIQEITPSPCMSSAECYHVNDHQFYF